MTTGRKVVFWSDFDFNYASIMMTPYSFEPDSGLPHDSSRGMRGRAGNETLIKNFYAS